MKRFLSLIMMLSLVITLCSCNNYTSSYTAVGLVKTQTAHSCSASFYSLKGRLVYKIKTSALNADGEIGYSAQIDEGEITIYYDAYGEMEELAQIKAGESVDGRGGNVESGKSVYIIIESKEKSRGKIFVGDDE